MEYTSLQINANIVTYNFEYDIKYIISDTKYHIVCKNETISHKVITVCYLLLEFKLKKFTSLRLNLKIDLNKFYNSFVS